MAIGSHVCFGVLFVCLVRLFEFLSQMDAQTHILFEPIPLVGIFRTHSGFKERIVEGATCNAASGLHVGRNPSQLILWAGKLNSPDWPKENN